MLALPSLCVQGQSKRDRQNVLVRSTELWRSLEYDLLVMRGNVCDNMLRKVGSKAQRLGLRGKSAHEFMQQLWGQWRWLGYVSASNGCHHTWGFGGVRRQIDN